MNWRESVPRLNRRAFVPVHRVVVPSRSRLFASLVLLACALLAPRVLAGEVVRDDAGVSRYTLPNGLSVVIVPTASGDRGEGGSLQLWLLVRAGAMEERDGERGSALLATQLIGRGVGGYGEDAVASMLVEGEADPAQHGEGRGAYALLSHAYFTGHAPSGDASAIGEVLSYYARVLDPGGWSVEHESFESARSALRSRVQEALVGSMRARQRWLARLLGEGVIGTRLTLPEPKEIDRLTPEVLGGFAWRVYRPSRSTLLVVGDAGGVRLEELIERSLGGLARLDPGEAVDPVAGLGGASVAFEHEPGWDGHIAALLWVSPRDRAADEPGVCDIDLLRSWVIDRVADEVIAQRVERLGLSRLGEGMVTADRFVLGGRVEASQCVVRREGTTVADWRRSLRVLLEECDRLGRDGAGRDEIVRARGAVLAEWHWEAESWRGSSARERASEVHWLVVDSMPVLTPRRWDELGTRLMSTIRDEEINTAVRERMDVSRAKLLVTRGGPAPAEGRDEGADESEAGILSLRDRVLAQPLPAIDPSWMRSLGGEVLDADRREGKVERLTQHAPSGTWGATLGSGVRLWARRLGREDRVTLCATLWGPMFVDGSLSESEIEAAMLAWSHPSSATRDAGWLAVYMETRGIEIEVQRVFGGVRLSVEAPSEEVDASLQLLTLLLDRPMIDADAFRAWAGRSRDASAGLDPLDEGFARLYCPALLDRSGDVTLDDAQRALARIVRHARIGVGVVGAVDPTEVIERGGALLGSLASRDASGGLGCEPSEAGAGSVCTLQVDAAQSGVVVGLRGGEPEDLPGLRATIVVARLLDEEVKRLARARGLPEDALTVQVVMSESLGGRWALILRAARDGSEACDAIFDEAIRRLLEDGIDPDSLQRVRSHFVDLIDATFDRPGYWSVRLSSLGLQGRSVEDIWSIRQAYASLDADALLEALRALRREGDSFRIELRAQR